MCQILYLISYNHYFAFTAVQVRRSRMLRAVRVQLGRDAFVQGVGLHRERRLQHRGGVLQSRLAILPGIQGAVSVLLGVIHLLKAAQG